MALLCSYFSLQVVIESEILQTLESLSMDLVEGVDEVFLLEEIVEIERLAGIEGIDAHQPELLQVPKCQRARLTEVAQLLLKRLAGVEGVDGHHPELLAEAAQLRAGKVDVRLQVGEDGDG